MTYPGLTERLDAIDIEKYPVAGLLRPVYAMFTKDDERLRGYLDQARAGRDEWLVAASLDDDREPWRKTTGTSRRCAPPPPRRCDRFRALGERWGLSAALQTAGNIGLLDGDLDGAVAAYTEAGRLLAELGHREDLSQVQLRLAEIAARQGDLARARELSAAARSAAESDGSSIDRGIAAAWWAGFEAAWGDIDAARPLHADTERQLARFSPAHPAREHLEAMVAATGALIAIADEDMRAAREQAVRSYRAAVAAQDMPLLAMASGAVAELAFALGQHERAAELLGARTVVRGIDDPTDPTALKLAPLLRAALGDGRLTPPPTRPAKALEPGRGDRAPRPGRARLIRSGGCSRAAPAGRTPRAARGSTRTSSRPARRPGRRAAAPRTALTRCESGLTFTNACSQPGIVEAWTNALLPNDSGKMSRNITPCTAPAVRTVMPTHSETHANDRAKQIEMPSAASSISGLVVMRKPSR